MSYVPLRSRRELLLQVLRDPERKSIPKMAMEYASCWIDKGERPGYYFRHFLYRKSYENVRTYLGREEFRRIRRHVRRRGKVRILDNKIIFHRYFSEVPGVCLPRYLGHSENGAFHGHNGETQPFWDRYAVETQIKRLVEDASAQGSTSFFAKPSTGSHGRGVMRITAETLSRVDWEELSRVDMIFQATVDQHPDLAVVFPDTLNTMRITTYRPPGENAVVGSAWIRFGRRGTSPDNASIGGMFMGADTRMGIDIDRGITVGLGQTQFDYGGQLYSRHPDTNYELMGVRIPDFEDATEMAMTAANAIDYPIVGWDVAISKKGPVLIEGNAGSVYHSDEMTNRIGYLSHPVFGPFICDIQREIRRKHRK